MNINVKRAVLENLNEVSELFNAYRVFYKQESNLSFESIIRIKKLFMRENETTKGRTSGWHFCCCRCFCMDIKKFLK